MTEPVRRHPPARRAAVVTMVMLASPAVSGFAAAPSPAGGDQCAAAGQSGPVDPWAQQLLAPEPVWPLTTGGGQRIAVLDSGVDGAAPQLRGHVDAGYDAITGHVGASTDCLGTGTHVAGVIAAQKRASGVYGLAPGATVVPVRVVGEPGAQMSATPTAAALAGGIRWAAAHADVVDISVWLTKDDPGVRQAVSDAVTAGTTLVAAVGDLGSADDGNPTTYPAAYPGVIGVTAIGSGGVPWDGAERGAYVDLAAPGAGVPVLARGHGVVTVDGSTAVAAGFVSAAAALVRARRPGASAGQVVRRLLGAASPPPGGPARYGIVNPVQAVTADLTAKATEPAPALRPVTRSPAEVAAAEAARRARERAVQWTVVALGVLLVVTLLAVGIPRARRRAWRPAYAAEPEVRPEPIEPVPVPPLFDE